MPRLAFAYLRVSTRKQDEENQRIQITNYAKVHDLTVADDGWFTDKAVSGAKVPPMKRAGFRDMYETLEAITQEEPAAAPKNVLVYEVSRLGRNFWEMLEVIQPLEETWPIISTSPKEAFLQIEDRSMRQLFLSILAWAAEREREVLVQRVTDGLVRAKEEGRHSGNTPLGYYQHDCEKEGHIECDRSGRLFLNEQGKAVYKLLRLVPKTTATQVQIALSIPKYKQAWNLLQSVRKFGVR